MVPMKRVLAVSSQVARGHVGNSAAVLALQRLGHEVWPLPTVILSNHPGHEKVAGTRIDPRKLSEMLDALDGNGWLGELDGVLTGYLPSAEHVAVAAEAIARLRVRRSDLLVFCDTVLGDDPDGLYIGEDAARAIRDVLVPLAGFITPNRFELSWLSGRPVRSSEEAAEAAAQLAVPHVLATSVPAADGATLDNLLTHPGDTLLASVPRRAEAPHGTGDLLAALMLGRLLQSPGDLPRALSLAVAGVEAAIAASEGAGELQLVASQAAWADPQPWPVTRPGHRA